MGRRGQECRCCDSCDIGDIFLSNRRGITALGRPSGWNIGPDINLVGPGHPLTTRNVDTGWVVQTPFSPDAIYSRNTFPVVLPFDGIPDYPDGQIAFRDIVNFELMYTNCVYSYKFTRTRLVAAPFLRSTQQAGFQTSFEIYLISSADSIAIVATGTRSFGDFLIPFINRNPPGCQPVSYPSPIFGRIVYCTSRWNNLDRQQFLQSGMNFSNTPAETELFCTDGRAVQGENLFCGGNFVGSRLLYQERSCGGGPAGSPTWPGAPANQAGFCTCETGKPTDAGVCPVVSFPQP